MMGGAYALGYISKDIEDYKNELYKNNEDIEEYKGQMYKSNEDTEEYKGHVYKNNEDVEEYESNKTRKLISVGGINNLHRELLKNEIYNKKIDNVKHGFNNKFLREINDAQKANIEELQLENELLRNNLQKYRILYFELKNK